MLDSNKCRLCGHQSKYLYTGKLIGHPIKYYDCDNCGYVQTEEPFWLNEAYEQSINDSDTGILRRNLINNRIIISLLFFFFNTKNIVLDYAGGYGILVRLLRDSGINAFWSDKFSENLVSRGFELKKDMKVDLVTAFEAFEHFEKPSEEFKRIFDLSDNLFISTCIIDDNPPEPGTWWYFGEEHGQHIGFLRKKTLFYISKKYGKKVVSFRGNYHLFSDSFSSNIFWAMLIVGSRILSPVISLFLKSKILDDHTLLSKETRN